MKRLNKKGQEERPEMGFMIKMLLIIGLLIIFFTIIIVRFKNVFLRN